MTSPLEARRLVGQGDDNIAQRPARSRPSPFGLPETPTADRDDIVGDAGLTTFQIRRGWQEESDRVVNAFKGQRAIVLGLCAEVDRLRERRESCRGAGSAEIERRGAAAGALADALLDLANAADDVGVKFFDTDTMDPLVEALQLATQAGRSALREAAA